MERERMCDDLVLFFFHLERFQILLMNEEITSAELDFFLRFPIKPHVTSPVDFLSNTSWGGICTLSAKEEFRWVCVCCSFPLHQNWHRPNKIGSWKRFELFFLFNTATWIETLKLHQNDGKNSWKPIVRRKRNSHKNGKIRQHCSVCAWCEHYGRLSNLFYVFFVLYEE